MQINTNKKISNGLKILITGAKGMLGTDISKTLEDHSLYLLDREELDLCDFQKTEDVISDISPDIVINCAAYTDVDKAEDDANIANMINGEVPGNLAKICKKLDIILIQISTEYVFDGKSTNGYSEDSKTCPINNYGLSKELGEKLIQENCEKYYIVRSSWLYGKNLQRGKERGVNFIERVIELAKEKDELNMVSDQFSKLTNTEDLSQTIKYIIENNLAFGIYHVVNEEIATPYEVALGICKIKNIDIKINPISYTSYPTKVKRPINAVLKNTKITKLRSWKEALSEYLL